MIGVEIHKDNANCCDTFTLLRIFTFYVTIFCQFWTKLERIIYFVYFYCIKYFTVLKIKLYNTLTNGIIWCVLVVYKYSILNAYLSPLSCRFLCFTCSWWRASTTTFITFLLITILASVASSTATTSPRRPTIFAT